MVFNILWNDPSTGTTLRETIKFNLRYKNIQDDKGSAIDPETETA